MVGELLTGESLEEIIFHFDVEAHNIPLVQFIETARSTQDVLDDFNEQLFNKTLQYELRVLPSETGGFIEILGLGVIGGGSAILAFLASDIGKAFVKGLTGEQPAYWAERLGKGIRNKIRDFSSNDKEKLKELSQYDMQEAISDDRKIAAKLLVGIIVLFLAADSEKLKQAGITTGKFQKAFSGRNSIYKACIGNTEVKGLSFDRSHDFRIKRDKFPQMIEDIPATVESEEEQEIVEIVDIIVNSPNWKRDGRMWQASTKKFQDTIFKIKDETFWHHVARKDIQPSISDSMRVQWVYSLARSKKPTNVTVLKVLTYNGKHISQPLSESELERALGESYIVEHDEPDLFSKS